MRKNFLLFPAFLACLFSFSIYGQTTQVASVVYTQHQIKSEILNEERTVLVRVPANYARTDERFPVIYMLDAHPPLNSTIVGIIEQQAWSGQMPEMIVVGITNIARGRDMTPSVVADGRGPSGGADKFLQFIETEVMPLVEKNYRTQPYRIFAGHSLSGMLAVYSALTRPDMFNAYIAASPHLQWDKGFVVKRAEEAFKQNRDWKKTMYVALGDEPDYLSSLNSFQDIVKKLKPKNFVYEFRQYKAENHGSVVLPALFDGLRKIYSGWTPPQNGSVSDIEDHYKKLSARFGYKIIPPEAMMNLIGYQLMRAGEVLEAIEVFKKNVENYPNSANCLDSLAEAFEKSGQLKQSKEFYEKAYKLAETHGETELARSAKANFERLSAKIN